MIRKAFKMQLLPGQRDEYFKRHNPIWEELQKVLRDHGVTSYSIYLDDDERTLFAYAEIQSEELWQTIADTEICKRWWKHMANLMETNEDNSPKTQDLVEVFHLT